MQKRALEFDFGDCITDDPLVKTKDLLVIYPVDEKNCLKDSRYFVYEYINAANLIVDTMHASFIKESKNIFDDNLALPLLNLYVNAIEFALKMLISKLKTHREKKCCLLIAPVSANHEVTLKKHKLSSLIKVCNSMLPIKGCLHTFSEFDEYASFIKLCEEYGVESMSTRYQLNLENKPYPLQLRQSWVNFRKLNKNISQICMGIINYVYSDNFDLCSIGEFTQTRLDELLFAKEVMVRKKSFFDKIIKHSSTEEIDIEPEMDLHKALESIAEEEKMFDSETKDLNKNELAALAMGLYFNCQPIVVPRLSTFKNMSEKENKRKILERASLYSNAIYLLNKHIEFVEKVINEKN